MKRAVIMGATSGMGQEVARILAGKGWKIGVAGRREEKLKELQQLFPQNIEYQVIDIEKENAPEHLLSLIDKIGGMDLYFHGSGVGWHNGELNLSKELKTVSTNALGFTRMVDSAWHCRHKLDCRSERPWPGSVLFSDQEFRQHLYPGTCPVVAEFWTENKVHRYKAWIRGHSAS